MSQMPPDFYLWDEEEEDIPAPAPRRRLRPGVVTALATIAVLILAAVFVNAQVLRISNVAVIGNRTLTRDQVIALSGLDQNVSYFSVTEDKIRAGVEQNCYLIYEGMEKRFPDSVTIYVSERTACANLQTSASVYLISADGMVLSRTADGKPDDSMLLVTGFQARDVRIGSVLVPGTAAKMEAFSTVIEELTLQGFIGQISELDLSNQDSLYLTTVDGYTVHLGDQTQMRAKIGTVRAVVAKLQEMGRTGGVIEASVPAVATYTPENL